LSCIKKNGAAIRGGSTQILQNFLFVCKIRPLQPILIELKITPEVVLDPVQKTPSQATTLPPLSLESDSPYSPPGGGGGGAAGGAGDVFPVFKRSRETSSLDKKPTLLPLAKRFASGSSKGIEASVPVSFLNLPDVLISSVAAFLRPQEQKTFTWVHPVIKDASLAREIHQQRSLCQLLWEMNPQSILYARYIIGHAEEFKLEELLAACLRLYTLNQAHAARHGLPNPDKALNVVGLSRDKAALLHEHYSTLLALMERPSWDIAALGIEANFLYLHQLAASDPYKLLRANRGNLSVLKCVIRVRPHLFKEIIPYKLQADSDFMREAISYYGKFIQFAAPPLNTDFSLIDLALTQCPEALEVISKDTPFPEGYLEVFLEEHPHLFPYAPRRYRTEKSYVLKGVQRRGDLIFKAPILLQRDIEIAEAAVVNNPHILPRLEPEVIAHERVYRAAAAGGAGMALACVPKEKRDVKPLALLTIRNAGDVFVTDPNKWRYELADILSLFPSCHNDLEVVRLAVTRYYSNYWKASKALQADLTIKVATAANFFEGEFKRLKTLKEKYFPHTNIDLYHRMLPEIAGLTDKNLKEIRGIVDSLDFRFQGAEDYLLKMFPSCPNLILFAEAVLFARPSFISSIYTLNLRGGVLALIRMQTLLNSEDSDAD